MNEEKVDPPDALGEAAKMLHCDSSELCYVNRVTQGLNMVSSMMPLERGDNIVVTDLGYPSNVFVWFPYRESGVEIRRIRHRDGLITLDDFEKAVDDHTKVVSISRVEWTSSLRYDMRAGRILWMIVIRPWVRLMLICIGVLWISLLLVARSGCVVRP